MPAEIQSWPIKEGAEGTAITLRYTKEDQSWERLPEAEVSFSHPDGSGQVRSFPRRPMPHQAHLLSHHTFEGIFWLAIQNKMGSSLGC